MSFANLQDKQLVNRNQLYFYKATMYNPKVNLRKQFHLEIATKRMKYLRINLTKNAIFMYLKIQITVERN